MLFPLTSPLAFGVSPNAMSEKSVRWISRDSIGDADNLNLYCYVANNPVNVTDPLGLQGAAGAAWGTACHYVPPMFDKGTAAAAEAAMDNNNWNSKKRNKEHGSNGHGNSDGTYGYGPPTPVTDNSHPWDPDVPPARVMKVVDIRTRRKTRTTMTNTFP